MTKCASGESNVAIYNSGFTISKSPGTMMSPAVITPSPETSSLNFPGRSDKAFILISLNLSNNSKTSSRTWGTEVYS